MDDNNDIFSSSKGYKNKGANSSGKKKKIINVLLILLSTLFVIGGVAMIYMHSALSSIFQGDGDVKLNMDAFNPSENVSGATDNPLPKVEETTGNLLKDPMVLNIALFGSDKRPDEESVGNSDTIMLISIDVRHQKTKITSFMRDTWVRIPKVDFDGKLNASYNAGGAPLAVDTIERNFGVDIDRYAVVDFDTFPQIIDSLGGIDIEINKEEAEYLDNDFWYRTPRFKSAGVYHLNGTEALDYARMRHVGKYDFERTQRQRDVMFAIVNKVKEDPDINSIVKMMVELLPSIKTNVTLDEMSSLVKNMSTYLQYPISQYRVPSDDNYRDETNSKWGMILVIDNMKKAREDLARFIYEETADSIYGKTSSQVSEVERITSSK